MSNCGITLTPLRASSGDRHKYKTELPLRSQLRRLLRALGICHAALTIAYAISPVVGQGSGTFRSKSFSLEKRFSKAVADRRAPRTIHGLPLIETAQMTRNTATFGLALSGGAALGRSALSRMLHSRFA